MRLLVTAYACEPDKGSEPGAGWEIVNRLSRHHDVRVVTRRNNAEGIEDELRTHPNPRLHFSYHDIGPLLPFKKLPGGVWWYHYAWHMTVGPLVERLHQAHGFDLCQQLTFGSFRFPGVLHRLGIPVVIGPLGGAEEPPVGQWVGLGSRGAITEVMRWTSNRFARVDPFLRRAFRSADLVLAVSPETEAAVRRIVGEETRIGRMPQSGIDVDRLPEAAVRTSDGPCAALHVGRLEGWKGAHLAIAAVAEARKRGTDVTLSILGRGPRRRHLERLSRRLGVQDHIRFIDRLPSLDDVFDLYGEHDVFLFPSLRESGGMALLEAMASGLPAVALSIGGPALSITNETGYRVPASRPETTIGYLADALVELAEDPERRQRMGRRAAERVRDKYAWNRKAESLDRFYEFVLRRGPLPEWAD